MPTSNHAAVQAAPGCSASRLESELQEILREPVSSARDRERTVFDRLPAGTNNRCVLFGAGSLGRSSLAALKGRGYPTAAMSDNNGKLWGTTVDGTPLLSPVEAAERFGKDALFIVTIRNEHHWYKGTYEQLRSLGCRHIVSGAPVCWRFSEKLLPFLLYDLPHKLYEQADRVLLAAQVWEDDVSRYEYLAHIRLRALGEPSGLPRPTPESYSSKASSTQPRASVSSTAGPLMETQFSSPCPATPLRKCRGNRSRLEVLSKARNLRCHAGSINPVKNPAAQMCDWCHAGYRLL